MPNNAQLQRLKHLLLLFLGPERFVRASTEKIVELRLRNHEGPFTQGHRADAEAFARTQATILRRTICTGITVTASTILLGVLAGWCLQWLFAPSKLSVYLMQAIGAAVILGATLGQFDRRHESFGGETLADQMNGYVFRALYVVGTFIFVTSVSWDAT